MSKNESVALRLLEDFRNGILSRSQVANLLQCSERAISRRVKKLRDQGIEDIKHGNYGNIPANRIEHSKRDQMLDLAKRLYYDFNMLHCLEKIHENHGLCTSYMTFHKWCREAGIAKRKQRRTSKSRVYRERMACEGLLLQMDGSHHRWNGKDEWCLIAMIDDATSEIPAARFFEGETTLGCTNVLRAVIEAKGVPQMIYTDQAGWAGGGPKRNGFSQFVRACKELDIRVIITSSAEAKGRIERAWRTTQDRLIPELRLAGITSMLDSNRYLDQVYVPKYWHVRNTVIARDSTSQYRPLQPHERRSLAVSPA
ncbi:MAG: ISNCY family transposase [Oligoflexus sp.]|nr:ISNCY family transposase [Oligoflexus sp.]